MTENRGRSSAPISPGRQPRIIPPTSIRRHSPITVANRDAAWCTRLHPHPSMPRRYGPEPMTAASGLRATVERAGTTSRRRNCSRGAKSELSRPRASTAIPRTSRSIATGSKTTAPTSIRRPTAARTGARSQTAFPTARSSTSCVPIRTCAGCSIAGTERGMYVSFDDGAALAIAATQSSGHVGARHRRPRRRSRDRDTRPLDVDHGRYRAAARNARAVGAAQTISSRPRKPRASIARAGLAAVLPTKARRFNPKSRRLPIRRWACTWITICAARLRRR